ncbi:Nucleolar protein 58 [Holothuria leucospilota]|uniref:Nucleolar protein 58 n=1 Tax=Holothuria leucospilota TaxID=206669 RepID=A0A9Q1HE23_HOLLE|nr:Nucleolar protein 58 [Holothuria leucospilota]
MLAAKCSLTVQYDALGGDSSAEVGLEARAKLEAWLRFLEVKGKKVKVEDEPPEEVPIKQEPEKQEEVAEPKTVSQTYLLQSVLLGLMGGCY